MEQTSLGRVTSGVEDGAGSDRSLSEAVHGVLSCYDRIVVTGTLPQVCYAEGMTAFLKARGVRIFDYPRFAEPLRDAIRVALRSWRLRRGYLPC